MALPPAFSDSAPAAVLIARFAVHDRLVRPLHPHSRQTIRHVVPRMSGLAGLEVQPVSALVLVVAVVRPVMDSSRLTVRVPRMDLVTTGLDLRLSAGAIAAWQIDRWARSGAGHQIPAGSGGI